MSDILTTRHDSVFDANQFKSIPIHIIGAGATGSRLWLSLVELGLTKIHAWDFDRVESHNLANQIFTAAHVGKLKTSALKMYYKLKTGQPAPDEMQFHHRKVEFAEALDLEGIVFLLTDTMESRKTIMNGITSNPNSNVIGVIETRMASSYGDVNWVNPHDKVAVQKWHESLIDDEDAEVSPCGASISVGSTASIIANLAVWQMITFLTDPIAMTPNTTIHLKPLLLA